MNQNIAIDGPAGAGKSTIARRVAAERKMIYVDTGAMYRAMGIFFQRKQVDLSDPAAVQAAADEADISIEYQNDAQQVILCGENVTGLLRTEEAGRGASLVSVLAPVRRKMVELQQRLASRTAVVMDGRDIGTVVLPDALLKIYLTASSEVRARRRCHELEEKGESCRFEDIQKDIEERDYRDMHREISPLTQADDAVLVDSSDMTIDEVVARILKLYEERL